MSFFQPSLRRLVFPFLLLLISPGTALPTNAQSRVNVNGVVTDSTDTGLEGATVVALQAADSALVSFGVTRSDGAFRLRRVPAGDYILQVTFVGFAPFAQPITVGSEDLDVGRLALKQSVSDLDELVISAEHVPLLIKSDTVEYNAAAFNVRPNTNVEELLKRLPGVEVDRDGSIKAQGEDVKQVLVDGKEFFGKDPTIATRNLPADAVDKVQVYDKKSDMAEFTGVDDGEEEKTINLALKEDKKQGYFGKVSGGYNGDDRFIGRANINRFSPSTQLSMLANGNNINEQSFSMGDYMNLMGGMQAMMGGGGSFSFGGGTIPGRGPTDGFSTTFAGGLNFNHDFSKKTEVRSSYFLNHFDNKQDRFVQQQQVAGSNVSSRSVEDANRQSRNLNHRLNLNVKHEIDDGQDVQFRANVQTSTSSLDNRSSRETLSADDVLENTSNTSYNSNGTNYGGDASLTYRKRFAPGRSLVGELRSRLNDGDMDGDLMALNQFYQEGDLLTTDEIAQLQARQDHTFTHTERLSYTQPLSKRRLLQVEVEHQAVREDQDKSFFDLTDSGSVGNDDLSSAFERTYTYNRAGLNYRYDQDRLSYGLSVDVQRSMLDGVIRDADATIGNSFVHLLPSASLDYDLDTGKHLNLRYEASTREPSMQELQPFTDNSDPLNVYVGNPALRPEYQHSANMHFTLFDQFTFTNFFAFARASYAQNSIVRARTIDEQFRQTITSVNADGEWTLSGNLSFGTPIRRLRSKINLSTQTTYNRGIEFINDVENATRILRSSWNLRLENRNKDLVDASVGARYTFNVNRYSLNQDLNQSYVNRSFYTDLTVTPTDAWSLSTSLDYRLFANDVFGSGQSVPLWSAEISRSLLNNQVQVQLVATDLLNKNVGVNYANTNTYIQEEQINTLGRYVMLKLVYNLSGFGGNRVPAIQIERIGE